MAYRAHPSVVRFLKGFRDRLEVHYNPNWQSPEERFLVCEPMRVFQAVDEAAGLYIVRDEPFAVRWMQDASEVDQRIVSSLWESLHEPDSREADRQRRRRVLKDYENNVDAWARDVGHWHFKREIDQYNTCLIPSKDPTRKRKTLEDQVGRELKV